MKFDFCKIRIVEKDRYKIAFTVPFRPYKWNVMPFELKNAPSKFQCILNNVLNYFFKFSIVYIDDVLVYSKKLDQHFKHLKTFFNKGNG